jgi:hypothetical protein
LLCVCGRQPYRPTSRHKSRRPQLLRLTDKITENQSKCSTNINKHINYHSSSVRDLNIAELQTNHIKALLDPLLAETYYILVEKTVRHSVYLPFAILLVGTSRYSSKPQLKPQTCQPCFQESVQDFNVLKTRVLLTRNVVATLHSQCCRSALIL